MVRFKDRFYVSNDFDSTSLDILVPKMILQPLVENALMHGIEDYESQALLRLQSKMTKNNELIITVFNEGTPISPDKLQDIHSSLEHPIDVINASNKQIGIYNVNNRLKLTYGSEFGLKIDSSNKGNSCNDTNTKHRIIYPTKVKGG